MEAFGRPGIPPTWTSGAKDWVSTALGKSRLWYTLGHGILNEVYWPATGRPQVRDLGFIVAKEGFWAEVKRVNRYRLEAEPLSPAVRVVHEGEGYRLILEFVPDPDRDSLLIGYVLEGEGFRPYPLLAPHLGGSGRGNTVWVEAWQGERQREGALMAFKEGQALTLLGPFLRGSAGYVGFSDGWQDFAQNGAMTWTFPEATHGNVALMAELPGPRGLLALAFASTPEGARTLARSSLLEGLESIKKRLPPLGLRYPTLSHGKRTNSSSGKPGSAITSLRFTRTAPTRVPWWRAFPSPGGTPGTTPGGTTWCGTGIWWRWPSPT